MIETLPKFPYFRLFTIHDITWYRDYYLDNNLNPYSDISPDDLLVWLDYNNDLMVSELEEAVVLRYTNVLDNNLINIMPLINPLSDSIIEKVMAYLSSNNLPLELHEVPAVICDKLGQDKWLIEDDINSVEYVLNIDQQILLEGSDFSHQRNRVKSFEREHLNDLIEVKYYEEIRNEVREAFLNHISTMPLDNSEEVSRINIAEPAAIKKSLGYALTFHKKALIIKINGKIVSLAMVSNLDKNTVGGNFLKVDCSVRNIFRYTVYQLAKALKQAGITEINIEQDLGIDGIRSFKKSLSPSRFLDKKIIRPRHQ